MIKAMAVVAMLTGCRDGVIVETIEDSAPETETILEALAVEAYNQAPMAYLCGAVDSACDIAAAFSRYGLYSTSCSRVFVRVPADARLCAAFAADCAAVYDCVIASGVTGVVEWLDDKQQRREYNRHTALDDSDCRVTINCEVTDATNWSQEL